MVTHREVLHWSYTTRRDVIPQYCKSKEEKLVGNNLFIESDVRAQFSP